MRFAAKYIFATTLFSAYCTSVSATPLNLRITDQTGAAFPNVLVIVKSLENKGEIFRELTDLPGRVSERDLPSGLYRVIATCPYGVCETRLSEFLVGGKRLNLELSVRVSPTRGNVLVVPPPSHLKVELLDADGRPMKLVEMLVRDSIAENERWYKTNNEGQADVDLLSVPMTFIVLFKGNLYEETVNPDSIKPLKNGDRLLIIHPN